MGGLHEIAEFIMTYPWESAAACLAFGYGSHAVYDKIFGRRKYLQRCTIEHKDAIATLRSPKGYDLALYFDMDGDGIYRTKSRLKEENLHQHEALLERANKNLESRIKATKKQAKAPTPKSGQ